MSVYVMGCRWILGLSLILFSSLGFSQIKFSNESSSAGPFFFGESWGASWGDINGDGCPDLFVSNHRRHPSLYKNNCKGGFTDIARSVDVSDTWSKDPLTDHHGATWVDYDSDGDQDLTISTGSCCLPQFFTNKNGKLINDTQKSKIVDDGGGRMPFYFDYDRDNRIDLALMNSGTSKLMEQKPNGTFALVSKNASGFKCTGFRSNYAQLSDFDDDVAFGGTMEAMCMQDGVSPARAYNTESLPFKNISHRLPVERAVVDTIIADFDGNLLPDIFMLRGGLRHNQVLKGGSKYIEGRIQAGPGKQRTLTFTASGNLEVEFHSITTAKKGSADKIFIGSKGFHPASGRKFTLFPNNSKYRGIKTRKASSSENALYVGYDAARSKWTIILSAATPSARSPFTGTRGYIIIKAANSIGVPTLDPLLAVDKAMNPKLHMNNGGGVFREQSATRGLKPKIACVSGVAADFDNDMDLDLYLVCRGGAENLANKLYQNNGNGNFKEIANAGGAQGITGLTLFDKAGNGESVVTADYDFDGKVDVFVTNGLNLQPFEHKPKGGGPSQLFRNRTSNSNHWIELDLVGTTSNIDAIGAKVYATAGSVTQLREQNHGYHRWSQNHQRIHFGLGRHQRVNLEIQWPSGRIDQYKNVRTNRIYEVKERYSMKAINPGK